MTARETREIYERMVILKSVLFLYMSEDLRKIAADLIYWEKQRMKEGTKEARMECIEKWTEKDAQFYQVAEELLKESDTFDKKQVVDFIRNTCFNASYMALYQSLVSFSFTLPPECRGDSSQITFSQSTIKNFLTSLVFTILREEESVKEETNPLISVIKDENTELKDEFLESLWDFTKQFAEKVEKIEAKEEAEKIKKTKEIERLKTNNIYRLTPKHIIGWLLFFSFGLIAIYYYKRKPKKKEGKGINIEEEIKIRFNIWKSNVIWCTLFYIVSFFLLKNAIDKWIRPNVEWMLKNRFYTTVLSITGLLGILFIIEGYVSSKLKTPLQRLSVKIENSDMEEKLKKELISKTQHSNETFKETLKRFGLLTIAGTLIGLLGKVFSEEWISNFCYLIPAAYAGWVIWQVEKTLNAIKTTDDEKSNQPKLQTTKAAEIKKSKIKKKKLTKL